MLSDESSSDSETGRFKCKSQDEKTSNQKSDNSRETERGRHFGNDRFNRSFDRRRDNKNPRDRDRDRPKYSRHSPVNRRRYSRDRSSKRRSLDKSRRRESNDKSPKRRSLEKSRHRDSSDRSKPRDHRSHSKDQYRHTKSRSYISHDNRKTSKEDNKYSIDHANSPEKLVRKSRENTLSPVHRGKRSEIYIPPPMVKRSPEKRKSESTIIIDENEHSDREVPVGSYYSMIPAVVKEKSDSTSDIDSSDDEKLRAKLLKREHHESKKQKKHKKKHKRKSLKSSKERESHDTAVEVSSTTDIKPIVDVSDGQDVEEVTSTQKTVQKESCEEGEISSDDSQFEIDPTDLRHKLRLSANKTHTKSRDDVCGPALPPHLEKHYTRRMSPELEGPALPPHFQRSKNLGPTIPDKMRKVLAEREVIAYESLDEDDGIGPLPAGSEDKWSDAHRRLEERALDIKIKKLDGHSEEKVKSREKWMLELPEGRAKYIGLEARSFRAKEGPDMSDRSSWTDTPEEKAKKAAGQVKEADLDMKLKEDTRLRHIANRDDEQESAVKKHKKKHKREESLLEMHQKKLRKKKKKEEKDDGKKERRPFSRDVDLQVNRFDEAQKKSIIKKAQDLNTRFGRGEAKYL